LEALEQEELDSKLLDVGETPLDLPSVPKNEPSLFFSFKQRIFFSSFLLNQY